MSRARVLVHYLRARRRHLGDPEDVRRWQEARLRRVLAAAPGRYPYYGKLFASGAPRDLADLPILDKPDVLAHFADLNTRGVSLDECLAAARAAEKGRVFTTALRGLNVGLSSGTSGQQTAFLTSAAERDRWAAEVLARALPEGLRQAERITLVLRAGGPLYESVDGGRISFRFVDLALPADRLVDEVVAGEPTILVAPPSVLTMLARDGRLGRRTGNPGRAGGLRRVFSAAEVLDPHDAAAIEAGLGLRVDQVYQAAEGFLGMSCLEGRLHLAEDLVVVEREDLGDGRFVPVVTDLFRTSQAVLRRRLGDVLVPAQGRCPCGQATTVVERIEGRSDDILWLARSHGSAEPGAVREADTGGMGPFFPDFVRAAVLAVPGVADFRVVQTADDQLRLAVEPAETFPAARDGLVAALARAGFAEPTVEPGPIERRDPTTKLRRVRREVQGPAR